MVGAVVDLGMGREDTGGVIGVILATNFGLAFGTGFALMFDLACALGTAITVVLLAVDFFGVTAFGAGFALALMMGFAFFGSATFLATTFLAVVFFVVAFFVLVLGAMARFDFGAVLVATLALVFGFNFDDFDADFGTFAAAFFVVFTTFLADIFRFAVANVVSPDSTMLTRAKGMSAMVFPQQRPSPKFENA